MPNATVAGDGGYDIQVCSVSCVLGDVLVLIIFKAYSNDIRLLLVYFYQADL